MKKRYTLILTGLTTLALLTACGKTPEITTNSRTSSSSSSVASSSEVNSSSLVEESSSSSEVSSSTVSSSSTETSASSSAETMLPAMNVDEVSQGVYTSIVGTWRNSKGNEITFDENGLVGETSLGQYGDFSSGIFTVGVHTPGQGGYALMMIPKDSIIPDKLFYEGSDTSDNSRDRMVGTQSLLNSSDLDPFYRVTE